MNTHYTYKVYMGIIIKGTIARGTTIFPMTKQLL